MDGLKNGNFPLLYVMKMSLARGVGGSKSLKTPLRNIEIVPNQNLLTRSNLIDHDV